MASIEQIIRPFASPAPFSTRRVVATSIKEPTETAHISWGSAGTLPSAIETGVLGPALSGGFNVKKEDQRLVEKSRETEKVKIEQEGNPDNFVVYERPKTMSFELPPGSKIEDLGKQQGKEPTYLIKGNAAAASSQTAAVTKPRGPVTDAGGDIPVTVTGDTLWVDKRNLPGQGAVPGYFQIGDRIFTYNPPPLGPNESIVE